MCNVYIDSFSSIHARLNVLLWSRWSLTEKKHFHFSILLWMFCVAAAGFSYFFLFYTEKGKGQPSYIDRHSPLFVLVVRLLMSIFPSWLPTRSWKIFILLLRRFCKSNYLWILSCFQFQYRYLNSMANRRLVSSAFGVYYFENESVVSRTVTSLWAANNKRRWSSEWNEGRCK
jgi:hypothetical protein